MTPCSRESQVQAKVDSLTEQFLRRAGADVIRLREMNERIRHGDLTALEEVERVAHSIHGAGALFGFPEISAAGGAIERLAEEGLANASAFSATQESIMLRQLLECTEQLAHRVSAAAHTEPSSAGMFQ